MGLTQTGCRVLTAVCAPSHVLGSVRHAYIPLRKEKVLTRAGYIGLQMRINEQMGRGLSIAGRDILVGHLTLLAASNATD